MDGMNRWSWIAIGCLAGFVPGCDDDDDGTSSGSATSDDAPSTESGGPDDGTTTQPECTEIADCGSGQMCSDGTCEDMFWVVGDEGTVIRVGAGGQAEPHPSLPQDVAAIECIGTTEAWLVGGSGLVARTIDAGATWVIVDSPTTADLRDVEGDHGDVITAVGVDGTWIISRAGVMSSILGATGELRGVAMGTAGMLAVGEGGAVWAAEPGADVATQTAELDGAPWAIDLAHHATTGIAVGQSGAVWWSDDGTAWTRRDVDVVTDLHAVQIAGDGRGAIAVGDDGVVLHLDATSSRIVRVDDHALRAVHLDIHGAGAAVGLGGVVASTVDFGGTFAVHVVSEHDLRGVDSLGPTHW